MVILAYKEYKEPASFFDVVTEELEEEYTNDEIVEFFEVIFRREILLALKYLRGSSGLDKSVMEPLKNPRTAEIVDNGLKWFRDNQDRFPFHFMDFDPDSDDSDYIPSDSDDSDDEELIFNNPAFAAMIDDDFWDAWDWDDEPLHADF